jgi:hypothetical protein
MKYQYLLSDRAFQDFMRSPQEVTQCFQGLIKSLETVPDFSHLHGHLGVKRLKHVKPTAWRHRCGDRRTVFTVTHSEGDVAAVIHRCGKRKTIYRDLPSYIQEYVTPHLKDLQEIDDQFETSLEEETLAEEVLDDKYNSHERHYLLPQALLENGIDYDSFLDFVAAGRFLQAPCLTKEQKEAAHQYLNDTPQIYRIQGAAGTGKTTVGLYLAAKAVEQGIYPIVILPNSNLVRFAKKSILSLNQRLIIGSSASEATQTDLTVIDWRNLRALLSAPHDQPLSILETHQIIDRVVQPRAGHQYKRIQGMNFCHLYYGFVCDGSYGRSSKDAISSTYDDAIQVLEKWKGLISENLGGQDLLGQIQRIEADPLRGHNTFQTISQNKPLLFIVDEVQDYYWFELSAILGFSLSQKNQTPVLLLGDENQRVTASGFTWSALSSQLSQHFNCKAKELTPLKQNFRNTASIARVAKYLLEDAFDLKTVTHKARKFPPASDPDNCYEEGSVPKLVVIDDDWLRSLVQALDAQSHEDDGQSNYVFIVRQENTDNDLICQYLESVDDRIVAYTIKEAKGQEFDAAIILYPFRLQRKQLVVDDLYDWYTSLTRARRYMALLVSQDELSWLESQLKDKTSIQLVLDIEEDLSPFQFAEQMRYEAKTFITLEQVRKRILYRICRNTITWLNGVNSPQGFEFYCNKGQFNYWELADLVFETAQDFLLNEENPIKPKSIKFRPPKGYSLYDNLVLYAGAFPFLTASKVDFRSWEDSIVVDLETTLQGEDDLKETVLETVQNPLLKVLVLRALGYSWDAAEASPETNVYRKHCIYGISRDLERRSLIVESQRIKAVFLGEDIKSNVNFSRLLGDRGQLVDALCHDFLASL